MTWHDISFPLSQVSPKVGRKGTALLMRLKKTIHGFKTQGPEDTALPQWPPVLSYLPCLVSGWFVQGICFLYSLHQSRPRAREVFIRPFTSPPLVLAGSKSLSTVGMTIQKWTSKPGVAVHACNPSAYEAEAGRLSLRPV